ncbi:carboxypeptidase-like regulatory domain-containing protein [Flavobacterium davisii]|uniref:carboxypeptidase-like regulatory domain-containing protein n=1 Tax=Flavobacterium davisii TaxID=2906077 RepID=UPI001F18BAC5|nr:carboxypeptidase-like regulatory domain-containing protein [Flavobacterium davisii]
MTVKSEGKTISGAITKDNGAFSISSLPLKNLIIEIIFMGYKKYVNTVTLTSENKISI